MKGLPAGLEVQIFMSSASYFQPTLLTSLTSKSSSGTTTAGKFRQDLIKLRKLSHEDEADKNTTQSGSPEKPPKLQEEIKRATKAYEGRFVCKIANIPVPQVPNFPHSASAGVIRVEVEKQLGSIAILFNITKQIKTA